MRRTYSVEFIIFRLNLRASTQKGLVEIKQDNFHSIAEDNIGKNYKEVFDEQLRKQLGVTALQLKPDAVPNRRIPVLVCQELKEEQDRLTRLGVSEPVKKPILWVSQLAITRKNGALNMPGPP